MKEPLNGKIYLALLNDNIMDAIDVNVKVVAIQLNQTWETRTVNKMNVVANHISFLKN
jgi:hypothetical protein